MILLGSMTKLETSNDDRAAFRRQGQATPGI